MTLLPHYTYTSKRHGTKILERNVKLCSETKHKVAEQNAKLPNVTANYETKQDRNSDKIR